MRVALVSVLLLLLTLANNTVAQDLRAKHMPTLLPPNKAATACDGKNFPINKGASASCCQVGKDIVHINPTGGLSHRQLGRACSKLDGSTHCVGKECDFGPCGMRIVETLDGTNSFVFIPSARPQQPPACGYQTTINKTDVVFAPQRYSHQKLYPGVEPLCQYTTCLDGGIPAVTPP